MEFPVQKEHGHTLQYTSNNYMCCYHITEYIILYLIWIGSSHPYGVKQILKAMRNRPEVQSHLVGHQCVSVVK